MLARFDLVLGLGASPEPEALGIQRYVLELQLDILSPRAGRDNSLSSFEVRNVVLCSVGSRWVGGFSLLVENSN